MDSQRQRGRFRIEEDQTDDAEPDEAKEEGPSAAAAAQWEYERADGAEHAMDHGERCDAEGYIGWANRREFALEMKRRRIVRRSKNKEYSDRVMAYQRTEFLFQRIQ